MIRAVMTTLAFMISVPAGAEMRVPQSQAEIQMGFVPLVKQAAPAVVNIYAKRVVAARVSPFMNDPFFSELFRDFGRSRPRVQNSLGSGVILSEDGFVVSNYHVVGQATDIRVVLNDRREFQASVALADEESDLAILKLEDASGMPHLQFRDSDGVEVGELALAIGNPFGVGQTVSSGIVSGLARSGVATGNLRGYYIQTDAPINPGNSGGALVDINGALIGVNTAILTRSGGSNGIGFAIPASLVSAFLDQAREGKTRFEKPWAGMNGQPVDADIADSLGLNVPGGIVISDLHDISPFLAAGFRPGDVILAVDGQPVHTPAEMVYRMSVAGLGQKALVTRYRNAEAQDVEVHLVPAPDQPPRDTLILGDRTVIPGLTIENINPAVLAEFGLPLGSDGVVVADPGPVGARMGIRQGDVLKQVNGQDVRSTQSASDALQNPGRRLNLTVQRGGRQIAMRFRT